MTVKSEKVKTDRRGFLKFAGLGSLATGAAIISGEKAEASEALDAAKNGYKETDHVKTFYDSARF
ncbi:MAG: twin-arginine translocation signal domain-containing protein [Salaquimonas sp.]